MKRLTVLCLAAILLSACAQEQKEAKVMARFVPERSDDFVFENNLIAGRIYGQALEGNPTSPGIDIWVKLPGALVADDWYKHATEEDENYYHHDHGGKDCYKVSVSLGGGASAPLVENRIQYPATNYRSWEITDEAEDHITFILHYPEWTNNEQTFQLDKEITVFADEYFCKVTDTYTFTGTYTDSLEIAAGVFRHLANETIEEEIVDADRYALWEHASDQSIESEDGMLGVAVYVPGADYTCYSHGEDHGICVKKIVSGEPFTYWFGSCWSKGEITTSEEWFEKVRSL